MRVLRLCIWLASIAQIVENAVREGVGWRELAPRITNNTRVGLLPIAEHTARNRIAKATTKDYAYTVYKYVLCVSCIRV